MYLSPFSRSCSVHCYLYCLYAYLNPANVKGIQVYVSVCVTAHKHGKRKFVLLHVSKNSSETILRNLLHNTQFIYNQFTQISSHLQLIESVRNWSALTVTGHFFLTDPKSDITMKRKEKQFASE